MAKPTTDYNNLRSNKKHVMTVETAQFRQSAGETLADSVFFIATRAMKIKNIRQAHGTVGSDGGAVTLDVQKCTGTQAAGAGTTVMSGTFNLKGTVNTVNTATLAASAATLTLAAGDRLAVNVTGTTTAVAGVVVDVELEPTAALT